MSSHYRCITTRSKKSRTHGVDQTRDASTTRTEQHRPCTGRAAQAIRPIVGCTRSGHRNNTRGLLEPTLATLLLKPGKLFDITEMSSHFMCTNMWSKTKREHTALTKPATRPPHAQSNTDPALAVRLTQPGLSSTAHAKTERPVCLLSPRGTPLERPTSVVITWDPALNCRHSGGETASTTCTCVDMTNTETVPHLDGTACASTVCDEGQPSISLTNLG